MGAPETYLYDVARDTLKALAEAEPTANHIQKIVWMTDLRSFMEGKVSWRDSCIVNEALHWHRYKGLPIPEAFKKARRHLARPMD